MTWRLILIPSTVTLGVTLLRLGGELEGWPTVLFNPTAGGGAALVGITWLVPVFGAWFASKLTRDARDVRASRVLGIGALALVTVFAISFLVALIKKEQSSLGVLGVFAVSSVLGALVGLSAWPALGRTLLAYGLAARVPVVFVTLAAIRGHWGTHYDALPPGFPAMGPLATWFWIGLLPQMTIWMAFTVIVGTLAGGLALLAEERRAPGRRGAPRTVRPAVSAPIVRPASPSRPAASPAPPSIVRPAPPRGSRRT